MLEGFLYPHMTARWRHLFEIERREITSDKESRIPRTRHLLSRAASDWRHSLEECMPSSMQYISNFITATELNETQIYENLHSRGTFIFILDKHKLVLSAPNLCQDHSLSVAPVNPGTICLLSAALLGSISTHTVEAAWSLNRSH